jgi:3-dehydroquinate dehydratase-1
MIILSSNKFKVCVSLATNSVDKLPGLIASALQKRADFVEIRFDHDIYKNIDQALVITSKIRNKAIFTLRSKEEGGSFDGSNRERISLLEKMAMIRPMLLDVEISTLKKDRGIGQFLSENRVPILVSSHDFRKTSSPSTLRIKFKEMRKYSNYVKMITTARSIEDNFKLLSLYDDNDNTKLIAFAMGEHGILSRLLCNLYGGSPFTYASLDKQLAPGQLDIVLMKKIYNRIANNLKSK